MFSDRLRPIAANILSSKRPVSPENKSPSLSSEVSGVSVRQRTVGGKTPRPLTVWAAVFFNGHSSNVARRAYKSFKSTASAAKICARFDKISEALSDVGADLLETPGSGSERGLV